MNKENTCKNILNLIAIFTICLSFLVLHNSSLVFAATDKSTTAEEKEEILDDKQDELKKLEKKEKKYRDIINLKQKEQDIINAQIKKLENENLKIKDTIEENEDDIEELSQEISRTKSEIEQKENHISIQKKILRQFLREKYQNYSEESKHFALLNVANKYNNSHRDNISYATGKVGEFVKTIHDEQQALQEDKEKFEEKSKKIEDAKYKLEQRSEYLNSSKDYKRVLASQVNVEEDKYQTKLSKVLKEQLAIQQEINQLSVGQVGNFSMSDLPSKSTADFEMPMNKPYRRTQGYGKTDFAINTASYDFHNGVDYVAQGSQSILAAAKGKVKATGNMGRYGYGKWVAIDHGNGITTLYGHMSSVKTSRGDKIKQGDKIGIMGNTGYSTGPHMHFTVFASSTFEVVESSSVPGVYIPTGATVNPDMYL